MTKSALLEYISSFFGRSRIRYSDQLALDNGKGHSNFPVRAYSDGSQILGLATNLGISLPDDTSQQLSG